jgi:hypothetical protein
MKMVEMLKWCRLKRIIKFSDISKPTRTANMAKYWAYSFVNENRSIGSLVKPANDV